MRTPPVIKGLWVVSLLFLALWMASALRPRAFPAEARAYFTQEFLEQSVRRATLSYVNSGLATLAAFVALYLVGRWSARAFNTGRPIVVGLCLGTAGALLFALVSLPFGIYGLYLDRAYGLSRMQLPAWLLDYAKGTFLSVLEYSFAGAFVAWAFVRFPRTWHLVLGGSFVALSLVISMLYPVLIAPLFNKFHPLPEGQVLEDVRELAAAAGMKVDKVLVMEASAKTARANAYFTGIGRTKQVVLYDTLLSTNSPEEVRLVVAHELGHWKYGHVVKETFVSAAGVIAALWVFRLSLGPGLTLERVLVLLLIFSTLAGYALSPASSYMSRRFEVQSDAYSLSLTGRRSAFISSQVNLARTNLGDVQPPDFIRWFAWTHPTTLERIESAQK